MHEKEKEKEIDYNRFQVMGLTNEGLLCDTLDDIRMFVVVENVKPKKLLSEGVYSILIEGTHEVGDYVTGFVDEDENVKAKAVQPLDYESYRDEIVGRIISTSSDVINEYYCLVKVKLWV